MELKKAQTKLALLKGQESLTLYDVLGFFRDIYSDVGDEKHLTLENLPLGKENESIRLLSWLGTLVTKSYTVHQASLEGEPAHQMWTKNEDKLKELESRLAVLEGELEKSEEKLLEVQKLEETLKEKEALLRSQTEELPQKKEALEKEIAEKDAAIGRTEEELGELKESLKALEDRQKEADELKSQVAEEEKAALKKLESRLAALMARGEDWKEEEPLYDEALSRSETYQAAKEAWKERQAQAQAVMESYARAYAALLAQAGEGSLI